MPIAAGTQLFFEFSHLQGTPGLGSHRMNIHLRAKLHPAPTSTVMVSGGATIQVEVPGHGYSVLGTAHPSEHCIFGPGMTETRLVLSIDLQRLQLEAIESERNGNTLSLWLTHHSIAFFESGDLLPVSRQDSFPIDSSQWVKALDQCRFSDAFIWSVPLPRAGTPTQRASAELAEARQAINEGRYNDAAITARKIVEQLWRKRDGRSHLTSPLRQRGVDERFVALSDALFDLASAAAHADQHTLNEEWTRTDATAVVAITAVLMSRTATSAFTAV